MKFFKIAFFFSLILLFGAPVVTCVNAQEASDVITETVQAEAEFNPLETADTSSPRDTLRSFLSDMKFGIDDWRQIEYVTSPTGFGPMSARHRRLTSAIPLTTIPDLLPRVGF